MDRINRGRTLLTRFVLFIRTPLTHLIEPETGNDSRPRSNLDAESVPSTRIRLRFAKRGDLRFISHHDLLRTFERLLRRSKLPVAHSQGFNPRPKATFVLALGLGIEARRDIIDLEFTRPLDAAEVQDRLNAQAPVGLEFSEALAIAPGSPARPSASRYEIAVPPERRTQVETELGRFMAESSRIYLRRKPDRTVEIDLRRQVLDAGLAPDGRFWMRLAFSESGSARPEDVLESLGSRDLLTQGLVLIRSDIEIEPAPTPTPTPRVNVKPATFPDSDSNSTLVLKTDPIAALA